jgi:hypothetical protein
MIRGGTAGCWALLVAATLAHAQAPATPQGVRLRWQAGQVLVYRAEQSWQATEVLGGKTSEIKNRSVATKRWQVLAVDAAGIATVQLSLTALRNETTTAGGETLVFDSADPGKSTAGLREEQARYLNTPLAVLRIDPSGRVAEVKESKFGPASRFANELPFVGVLPAALTQAGQAWERPYEIALDPPEGTGEKYAAAQKFTCKALTGTAATVDFVTEVKALPEAAADQVPLLRLQPAGQLVYDVRNGRLHGAALRVDKEVKGHQGEGSSFRYQSTQTVQYVGDR